MCSPLYLCLLCFCACSAWRNLVAAAPVEHVLEKRSLVDDAIIEKALSFQPTTEGEFEQFRILTSLLKLIIDARVKQLERISALGEGRADRVRSELGRLRRYSASLDETIRRYDTALNQQSEQRGGASTLGDSDQSVSRTVVNGINQPLWVLEQLRKAEQQRRRSSRSEVIGQIA